MMGEVSFVAPEQEIKIALPRVTLWRVLVEPYRVPLARESGIVLPDEVERSSKWLTIVGKVLAMGEQAFRSEKLADSGNPKVGDWVMYAMYGGQRVSMADGRDLVILNDSDILCVVPSPEMVRHYV
jgi:co-chaperonin GroES (HSP10)